MSEEPPPRAASLLPPPPHARSYLGDYFAWLDEHGDWAGVPPRGQYAAWHDADDAPVKHGARRPQGPYQTKAVPHVLPRVVPPASKKRPRSYAAAGARGARGRRGGRAGGGHHRSLWSRRAQSGRRAKACG